MDFKELIIALSKINEQLQEQSLRAINTSLTLRNWYFGFYIVEFEQRGKDRAGYGKSLLANIAIAMQGLTIPNTDERELRRYRQFYMAYPTVAILISSNDKNRGLANPDLVGTENNINKDSIRGLPNPELQIPDSHYFTLIN